MRSFWRKCASSAESFWLKARIDLQSLLRMANRGVARSSSPEPAGGPAAPGSWSGPGLPCSDPEPLAPGQAGQRVALRRVLAADPALVAKLPDAAEQEFP